MTAAAFAASADAEPSTPSFTAREYATVRVPARHEQLHRDTYRAFGWAVEAWRGPATSIVPATSTSTLKLTRDRALRGRQVLGELQREAEGALFRIEALERSRSVRATAVAVVLGLVGAVFLAGSVFLLDSGPSVVSIGLGVVGLGLWALAWPAHRMSAVRRAEQIAPLLDRQYDTVYDACERADALTR
ncbi:hypothetical protein BIV04_01585 [Frigoribacterium sp. MCBA15_019]|nr:hypothetical protein BIV04_01585 [Frigoribacterium sp. MCBA15_019]